MTAPVETDEVAKVAAKYWADFLRRDVAPSLVRDAGYLQGTPEDAKNGIVGDGMLSVLKKHLPPITMEMIDRFEEILAMKIVDLRRRLGIFASISVDYHPDRILYESAQEAEMPMRGFDIARFPYKYNMRIEPNGRIEVGEGYRVPWRTLRAPDADAEVSR